MSKTMNNRGVLKFQELHKMAKTLSKQSKSTKFVTSSSGHVDGVKKLTGNNS